jgi:hypothetical protein
MSFYRHETRRSMKRRICDWCGQRIETGDMYVSEACVFRGDFCASSLHPECRAAAEEAMREDHCGEIEYFQEDGRPFVHEGANI